MNEYRHGAHSVFEIHLHLVWVTKYRKPVLVGPVGHRVRDLIGEICGGLDVHILKGHESNDQPLGAAAQGEDGVLDAAGVRAVAEAVPGSALVGAGVFLLQSRSRDGSGGGGIHRE
jgi:hypothetical protein